MAVCEAGPNCSIVCQGPCWCIINVDGECFCDCLEGLAGHKDHLNIEPDHVISLCIQEMTLGHARDLLTDIGTMDLKAVADDKAGEILKVKYESMKFSEIAGKLGF